MTGCVVSPNFWGCLYVNQTLVCLPEIGSHPRSFLIATVQIDVLQQLSSSAGLRSNFSKSIAVYSKDVSVYDGMCQLVKSFFRLQVGSPPLVTSLQSCRQDFSRIFFRTHPVPAVDVPRLQLAAGTAIWGISSFQPAVRKPGLLSLLCGIF